MFLYLVFGFEDFSRALAGNARRDSLQSPWFCRRLPRRVDAFDSPGLLALPVPFFRAAGSEFEEMLVGQGARRVRELFGKWLYFYL